MGTVAPELHKTASESYLYWLHPYALLRNQQFYGTIWAFIHVSVDIVVVDVLLLAGVYAWSSRVHGLPEQRT